MSRSLKIVILLVGGLLVIIAVLVILFWGEKKMPAEVNGDLNQPGSGSLPIENRLIINDNTTVEITKENAPTLTEEQREEVDLERLAFSFIERFGSYSNQSNFENIRDLELFMTSSMKRWANKYISQNRSKMGDIYWGVTTKALAVKSIQIGEQQAMIVISTQRKETSADPNNYRIYNQDAELIFKKISGIWLLDGIYWQ